MGQPVPASLEKASTLAVVPVRVATGADGVLRAFAQTPLPRYGLVAYAGMPADEMYAEANSESLQRMAMALAAVVLGLATAWLAARQLAASLRSIADTARRLQEGHTDVRADPGLPGEFGEVAAEFNRLMDRNDERAAQLHRSEQHAVRLRCFYETLSDIGRAIARQCGPEVLHAQACRACVDSGLAQAAWVVVPDEALRWRVAAHCEVPPEVPAWAEHLADVVRRAVDAAAPCVEALPGTAAQMVAVPIVIEGAAVGALVLGAAGDAPFDDELLQLLGMLAVEVALGMNLAQHREARSALLAVEAASQAKTSFLSHVSHELRTPLNAVLGFAQLLRARLDATRDRAAQAHVAQVLAAGRQLKELIDDLMDVSRIEAGQLAIEMADVELVAKLHSLIELNRLLAARHGVGVAVQEPGPRTLWLRTDPLRLHQVLMNLLSNAIKYNRPGGQVRLRVAVDAAQGRASIRVEDDGEGMSPAQLKRLFTAFDRLGRERSSIEGTGIGLFITHRLVDLLGGSLAVDSTEGVGTTVTVSLPLGTPARTPPALPLLPEQPADDAEPLAGVVLYIEDNPVNALLVQHCLATHGQVRVLIAPTGEDGLRQAAELLPHLVLLDMQLPDLHGLEVMARLRADPRTAGLRVIALSASAMPAEVEAARRAGAHAYWTKPFEFDAFTAGVAKALREEAAARSEGGT
jgi:signal transduction histidine kinase/CheY-like chemotaxis protein/HAMP domain-containing protein